MITEKISIRGKEYIVDLESIRQDDCAPTNRHWSCWAKDDAGNEYIIAMMFEGDDWDQTDESDFDWENAEITEI